MTPLRFRYWRTQETPHHMVYSDSRYIFYEFFEQDCPDEDNAMGFTGMQDKTGKDIYENDIVRIFLLEAKSEMIAPVIWDPLEYKWAVELSPWHRPSISDFRVNIEVIGNIFETPELVDKCNVNIMLKRLSTRINLLSA